MQVRCSAYDYALDRWDELDVSATLKVYPCCAYQANYEVNPWDDERFKALPPDWNDLKKHDMETIKKTMFTILNVDNFNSGNCPQRCKNVCGVGIEEKHMAGRDDWPEERH